MCLVVGAQCKRGGAYWRAHGTCQSASMATKDILSRWHARVQLAQPRVCASCTRVESARAERMLFVLHATCAAWRAVAGRNNRNKVGTDCTPACLPTNPPAQPSTCAPAHFSAHRSTHSARPPTHPCPTEACGLCGGGGAFTLPFVRRASRRERCRRRRGASVDCRKVTTC